VSFSPSRSARSRGWSDAHAVRGSADIVEAALAQARDYAAAHRVPVSFEYETYREATNGIKRTAAFRIATFSDGQPIGTPLQRLPSNAWIIPDPSTLAASDDNLYGHYVFYPTGTVSNAVPDQLFTFFVVSRKMRDADGTPNIAYAIRIDPDTGTATSERYEH
jgi:hypothetical protein